MSRIAILYVAVGYLGNKAVKKDTYFGTGLTFLRGQTLDVPADVANQMIQHSDVYADANSARWEKFVAELEANGGKLPQGDKTQLTPPPEEVLKDKVSKLKAELGLMTRKDAIKEHEVTKLLEIEFDADTKLADMVATVVDAYAAQLSVKLGLTVKDGE